MQIIEKYLKITLNGAVIYNKYRRETRVMDTTGKPAKVKVTLGISQNKENRATGRNLWVKGDIIITSPCENTVDAKIQQGIEDIDVANNLLAQVGDLAAEILRRYEDGKHAN